MSDEQLPPLKIRIRADITLGTLLLGEYLRASKIADEHGLEQPSLPENVEEAMKVELGVQVTEITIPSSDALRPDKEAATGASS